MVRRSALVYELLRTEQPDDGYTEKEIVEEISSRHAIVPGKALRRQVAVALRRGLDFGILAKSRNRFRFDLDYAKASPAKQSVPRRKDQSKKKKKITGAETKRKQRPSGDKTSRKQTPAVPRPKLPRTPSWTPKRRNLADEPTPKVKKVP